MTPSASPEKLLIQKTIRDKTITANEREDSLSDSLQKRQGNECMENFNNHCHSNTRMDVLVRKNLKKVENVKKKNHLSDCSLLKEKGNRLRKHAKRETSLCSGSEDNGNTMNNKSGVMDNLLNKIKTQKTSGFSDDNAEPRKKKKSTA